MSLEITEEWIARQAPEAQVVIRLLLAQVAELRAEVAQLKAELARVRKTPENSSLPPSTQHPHAERLRKRPPSKKKRGGQPGHPKAERTLLPTEPCAEIVSRKPTQCRRCGTALSGNDQEPRRHQVWELPEFKPVVTEYQRHRLTCPGCGESTCGELPELGLQLRQLLPQFVNRFPQFCRIIHDARTIPKVRSRTTVSKSPWQSRGSLASVYAVRGPI